MDLRQQDIIKNLAEKNEKKLAVVLGFTDLELVEIIAETLTLGDPSGAGSLAGVQLGLKVYHILEDEFKNNVPADVWEEQMGLMETIVGPEKIEEINKLMKKIRNE